MLTLANSRICQKQCFYRKRKDALTRRQEFWGLAPPVPPTGPVTCPGWFRPLTCHPSQPRNLDSIVFTDFSALKFSDPLLTLGPTCLSGGQKKKKRERNKFPGMRASQCTWVSRFLGPPLSRLGLPNLPCKLPSSHLLGWLRKRQKAREDTNGL